MYSRLKRLQSLLRAITCCFDFVLGCSGICEQFKSNFWPKPKLQIYWQLIKLLKLLYILQNSLVLLFAIFVRTIYRAF